MNTARQQQTEAATAAQWDAIARRLTDIRRAARAERAVHGRILPETAHRLLEAMNDAGAWLQADGAIQHAKQQSARRAAR